MLMNKRGKIRIDFDVIAQGGIHRIFDALKFTPLDVQTEDYLGVFVYKGVSPLFDAIKHGDRVPFYSLKLSHEGEILKVSAEKE